MRIVLALKYLSIYEYIFTGINRVSDFRLFRFVEDIVNTGIVVISDSIVIIIVMVVAVVLLLVAVAVMDVVLLIIILFVVVVVVVVVVVLTLDIFLLFIRIFLEMLHITE